MSRYDQARELAAKFGFSREYEWVKNWNPSNNLPYHNWFHTCCMVCNCLEAADHYALPFRDHYLLGVSALFHDFNHSGGRETDDKNVSLAIRSFEFFKDYIELDRLQVAATIKITQYPYVDTPVTIEQKIIRDADLMQILEPEWFDHIILGLREEFKNGGREYSVLDMLKGQLTFISGSEFHTDWGKSKMRIEQDTVLFSRLKATSLLIEALSKNPYADPIALCRTELDRMKMYDRFLR